MSEHFQTLSARYVSLSAALKVRDSFTNQVPISPPVFKINGKPHKSYQHAPSGFWSLTGLNRGNYRLKTGARFYFPNIQELVLPEEQQYTVMLDPRPDYPYPPGSMIRGLLTAPLKTILFNILSQVQKLVRGLQQKQPKREISLEQILPQQLLLSLEQIYPQQQTFIQEQMLPQQLLLSLKTKLAQARELPEELVAPLGLVRVTAEYSREDPIENRSNALCVSFSDNQGNYNGRYALFLQNLIPDTEVKLTFFKADYEEAFATTKAEVMRTNYVNLEMTPCT